MTRVNNNPTPCGALFDVMKKHASISYKELAGLILSNRPLSDGRSPISRVGDRTWISRFIVHAPAGSLQERYFCDCGVAALRVMARLRSRANRPMRGSDVLVMLRDQGIPEMTAALSRIGEDASVLRNVFDRLVCGSGYSEDERADVAMVLFISAGCMGSARKAAAFALEYAQTSHGGRLAATPAIMMRDDDAEDAREIEPLPLSLGLLRVVDGYVKGSPHWVDPGSKEIEIGALALGDGDIADVGAGVSAHHARLVREGAAWFVRDLGSTNGTEIVSGATGERMIVHEGSTSRLSAGDRLVLGDDTVFIVIEGVPGA